MKNQKKLLNIIKEQNSKNVTCFSLHEKHKVACERKTCDNWINLKDDKNCVILAAKAGPKTLQEIGQIYDLTRMRICQIEKNIYEKIKNTILQT